MGLRFARQFFDGIAQQQTPQGFVTSDAGHDKRAVMRLGRFGNAFDRVARHGQDFIRHFAVRQTAFRQNLMVGRQATPHRSRQARAAIRCHDVHDDQLGLMLFGQLQRAIQRTSTACAQVSSEQNRACLLLHASPP